MDTAKEATDSGDPRPWSVQLRFEEDDTKTIAIASLTAGQRRLEARGSARRNPVDPSLPQVGEDLAVSRALWRLAHDLVSDAVSQLEAVTHQPAGIAEA